MELLLSIISVVLGVAGLSYGVYENRSKAKILDLKRRHSWSVYRSTHNVFSHFWTYYKNENNKPIPRDLEKAEASIRELHRKTIENVLSNYDYVEEKDIDNWKNSGRLEDEFSVREFKKELTT